MKIYEKVIILTLFSIFFGCSNPTEKFDGNYEPNIDETLKINTNLTLFFRAKRKSNLDGLLPEKTYNNLIVTIGY